MFENKGGRTELSQLGEFGLIEHLKKSIPLNNPETIKGIGDDAAVLDYGSGQVLATTDMLLEGVHFDLTFHPLRHLGYKAVVVNLSDIYAMNGKPLQVLVSIGLSNRFSLEAVEELYEGMNLACARYGVDLAGGDTCASKSGLVISVTALGRGLAGKTVFRDTAQVNDLICVTGDLGSAYVGLQILEREKKIFLENPSIQPDLAGYDYLLERQLKPEAKKEIIEKLDELQVIPTSMIDISDGLSSELIHLSRQSGVGCTIYENKIPIDTMMHATAGELNLVPTVCALNGGEDYELLFTIRQEDYEKIKSLKDISVIGHIASQDEGCHLVSTSGSAMELKAQGWNAFPG